MILFQRDGAGKSALLLGVCTFFAIATAAAQESRMSLPGGDMTLLEFVDEVRRQTGTTVIFDAGNVPSGQEVALPAGERTVAELLDTAFPRTKYAWKKIGAYAAVRTLPAVSTASAARPARQIPMEQFERDVAEYTRRNLDGMKQAETTYGTIRTEIPHSGIFNYPGREFTPVWTDLIAQGAVLRDTPPMLALKTNLVWWAARGTLNIGGEVGLGKKTSLELSGGLNRWGLDGTAENNKKLTHWIVKPEFRYWLCERFNGHFFGVHAFYGRFNVGGYDIPLLFEKEYRYEGQGYGAGVNYGYHLPLAKRWGVEFTAGVGVALLDYTKYNCAKCGDDLGEHSKTYFGPTELGVKLVFMIK